MNRLCLFVSVAVLLSLSACQPGQSAGDAATGAGAGANNVAAVDNAMELLGQSSAVSKVEPWRSDFGNGVVLNTAHYRIYTTMLDPLILGKLPGFIESAYHAYQQQLAEPVETRYPFRVYLFAERGQWEDFTKDFAGEGATTYFRIKKGAYFLNDVCVAYNIGITRTFSALAHEGWHQFNSRHFALRLPSWLDEGIATQFESVVEHDGRFVFQPGQNLARLGALKMTLSSGRFLPLPELLSLNPGQVITDPDSLMAFYAQSYALVRFLREDNYGIRMANYRNMLLDGLTGKWPIETQMRTIAANRNIPLTAGFNKLVSIKLFKAYIDEDIEQIGGEYKGFCRELAYYVRVKSDQ